MADANPFAKYAQPAANPFAKYATAAQPEPTYDPTDGMSTFDKVAAGTGKAVVDTLRGAGQWLGLTDREAVAEARARDAPLMKTTAGKVGNFAGNIAMLAPASMIPGAATVPGAAAIGGIYGAMQPSVSTAETAMNIGIGGAGGAAGQWGANKIGGAVTNMMDKRAAAFAGQQAADAQKFAAAKAGAEAGYVVPPADMNPGMMTEALSGLSGKIKTAQVASAKNQVVTDKLARKALGVGEDVPLNIETLNAIRQNAAQAYTPVAGSGTVLPGQTYTQALDDALKPFTSLQSSFPGVRTPKVVEEINALRAGQFDAGDALSMIRSMRESADIAYKAGENSAGKAYKSAAGALEDAIEQHLNGLGQPASQVLKDFRGARQTIAKTYTVQKALNDQTGSVSAPVLARELAKGKPLTDELRAVAQMGQAFPKATQALKEAPKATSPLDWAMALATSAGTGNALPMALVGARPVARSMLLSEPMQRAALQPQAFTPGMMGLLGSEPFRQLGGTFGAGGLLSAYGGQ